jgi:two-component system, NtrC family, sensor kinase
LEQEFLPVIMPINWKRKWSLQTRILMLIVVTTVTVLGAAEWLATRSALHSVEKAVGEQTAIATRRLANSLESVASTNFPVEYQNRVREILELEPNVSRVDVYADIDGVLKPVQSSSTRGIRSLQDREVRSFHAHRPDTFMVTNSGETELFSTYPLRFKDGREGFVTLVSSLWVVNDILATHLRIRVFAVLGTLVCLVVAIVLVFRTTVYRSVRHLVDVMERFKSGDASVRADESLTGEFGELASHFNRTLQEIQRFSHHLKQQVEAATEELTSRNRELQHVNMKLYETQKRLGQAERLALVGQLTATFAHEIGSPLSAISTHLQILLEDPQLDPKVRNRLHLTNNQIDRVCSIVESLLMSTHRSTRRVTVELEEMVYKVFYLLEPTMESRQIAFSFRGSDGPFLVEGDPDQLQQLFLNLFNNSLDAIQGAGSLSVEIRREAPPEKNGEAYFHIDVRDSGIGISASRLDHIFEPFFTTKEFGKGSGLGLAVSKEIVRHHEGQISVVSSLGRGTCFTICLPEARRSGLKAEPTMTAREVQS